MGTNKKKIFFETILRFILVSVIFFTGFLGELKNVYADSLNNGNFPKGSIVEHLKLDVPKRSKTAWLRAEEGSWEPWLLKQNGFLGRQLFWDPITEEATLLIGWESRSVWKNISEKEINLVQQDFEKIAREETNTANGNPFPLIYEGELNPE